jgi:hypothetical protein
MAMIAMTTSSSMSVKARRWQLREVMQVIIRRTGVGKASPRPAEIVNPNLAQISTAFAVSILAGSSQPWIAIANRPVGAYKPRALKADALSKLRRRDEQHAMRICTNLYTNPLSPVFIDC